LNRLTIRNVAKLSVGGVQYTAWANDAGHMLDDGTLFRLAPDRYRLCCQERHLNWLLDSAFGFDVTIHEETEEIAALSLQGPTSAEILRLAGFAIDGLKPFRMAEFPLGQGRLMISRTGFTGRLWAMNCGRRPIRRWRCGTCCFEAGKLHGMRPIGSEALNIARLEAGLIITGYDFTPADVCVREGPAAQPAGNGAGLADRLGKGPFHRQGGLGARSVTKGTKWSLCRAGDRR
jgi:aminomethyltransferase